MKFPYLCRNITILASICVLTTLILLWNIHVQDRLMDKDVAKKEHASSISKALVFPRGGDDLLFDQPWPIPTPKILPSLNELDKTHRFIMSNFSYSPGIGNLMFQYSALRVLAEKNDAYLILPSNCLLRRAFGKFSRVVYVEKDAVDGGLKANVKDGHRFDECCHVLAPLKLFEERSIEVVNGYFQSYRNFHPGYQRLIAQEFEFLPEIMVSAQQILEKAKTQLAIPYSQNSAQNDVPNKIASSIDLVFVGIHVRHGMDVTFHSRNLNHGHLSAPVDYFANGIDYFREKFEKKGKLIFLVASDAISWTKQALKKKVKDKALNFYFIESGYREIDLAVLSLCNHTILSTGTYSWWSGYLAGGRAANSQAETIYYKDWPKKGSAMDKMIDKPAYFLPSWVGL